MERFKKWLKDTWEEDPEKIIVLTVIAVGVTVKLAGAYSQHHRDVIWDREVARREYMTGVR